MMQQTQLTVHLNTLRRQGHERNADIMRLLKKADWRASQLRHKAVVVRQEFNDSAENERTDANMEATRR